MERDIMWEGIPIEDLSRAELREAVRRLMGDQKQMMDDVVRNRGNRSWNG